MAVFGRLSVAPGRWRRGGLDDAAAADGRGHIGGRVVVCPAVLVVAAGGGCGGGRGTEEGGGGVPGGRGQADQGPLVEAAGGVGRPPLPGTCARPDTKYSFQL